MCGYTKTLFQQTLQNIKWAKENATDALPAFIVENYRDFERKQRNGN